MHWIKLTCDVMEHRKIKMIRDGHREGDRLALLWVMMLLEAGKSDCGGYLMVSKSKPYTAKALSTCTGIAVGTVTKGLEIFESLGMIEVEGSAIFIKNWSKYQSQDELDERRQKDRERQQRARQRAREKAGQQHESRDSHVTSSRDVTQEKREEKKEEKTTDKIRLLLAGTSFSEVSDDALNGLMHEHGVTHVTMVCDVAAEGLRRSGKKLKNPEGYLHTVCESASFSVPEWFVPYSERIAMAEAADLKKNATLAAETAKRQTLEAEGEAKNRLWNSLPEERREAYRVTAREDTPIAFTLPEVITTLAKNLAWEENRPKAENHTPLEWKTY